MPIAVFAASKNSHLDLCRDANFEPASYHLYPAGNDRGQFGWNFGINYEGVSNLLEQLREVGEPISRLALSDHGSAGEFQMIGASVPLRTDTVSNHYSSVLSSINNMMVRGGALLLLGCNCGQGPKGAELLIALSNVLKGIKVVGFTTVAVEGHQRRLAKKCDNPGDRDTEYDDPMSDSQLREERYSNGKLLTFPWASETSRHAKVALDGAIIASPLESSSFQEELAGTWSVTIGDWPGYFRFSENMKAEWSSDGRTRWHRGHWGSSSGSFYWTFDDDAPGFKRQFEVLTPLKPPTTGEISIGGQKSGFFKMWKER